MNGSADLRLSPLDGVHRAAGARMVPFGGWDMPVSYPTGTIAEHMACRQGTTVFDVSHLGSLERSGPGAFDQLQAVLSNDLRRVRPGRAQYTHLLDEADAWVVDDIIVWWLGVDRFWILPNAANNAGVVEALPGCEDVAADRTLLALQGPTARSVLSSVSPEAAEVGRFGVATFLWRGEEAMVAGTGYTGEDGVEIALPNGLAEGLWEALVAGAPSRRDSVHATRCGWRPGSRCTATNWGPGSPPSMPAWAGWSAGKRRPSGAGTRSGPVARADRR